MSGLARSFSRWRSASHKDEQPLLKRPHLDLQGRRGLWHGRADAGCERKSHKESAKTRHREIKIKISRLLLNPTFTTVDEACTRS